MFLKWDNGLMLVSDIEKSGYKPAVYTDAPTAPTGFEAKFVWIETEDSFVQTWEIVPVSDEISDSEALDIILGGADE